MKTIALCLLIFSAAYAVGAARRPGTEGNAELLVVVYGDDEDTIGEATVRIFSQTDEAAGAAGAAGKETTDNLGYARFKLAEDAYRIVVTKEGYRTFYKNNICLIRDRPKTVIVEMSEEEEETGIAALR